MGTFTIAEIGINHNGDMKIAKKLIDIAKQSGWDSVKFQKRDINVVYTNEYLNSYRESPWGKTQREQKEGLEFDYDEYMEISKYCLEMNIEWFASPWDLNSVDFLRKFDCSKAKIASPMLTHTELLKEVAQDKRHTFISTGMSSEEEISKAVEIFEQRNCSYELMHCVSTYPMEPKDANLKCISWLQEKFKCDVGYSGHETNLSISIAAASLGISSLERHITLDRSMYGSDQAASLGIEGMRRLISSLKVVEEAFGDGKKVILEEEIQNAKKLRYI